MRHPNVVCDGCSKCGIAGIVFKCEQCANYHLCSSCYGADLHDREHPFIRYTTPTSLGWVFWNNNMNELRKEKKIFGFRVHVPPRKGSKRIQLRGIFVGAKVARGPDWEWGQQDGGEGNNSNSL